MVAQYSGMERLIIHVSFMCAHGFGLVVFDLGDEVFGEIELPESFGSSFS